MRTINRQLRASTLVETLVMMLVAGIVFLAVMEGMTLFSRLVARRTQALLGNGRQVEGYFRVGEMVARADSILIPGFGRLEVWRAGRKSLLSLRDSALICQTGALCDTLLRGVGCLRLDAGNSGVDTVEIGLGGGFTARFTTVYPALRYRIALEETEKGYGYEE